MLVMIIGGVFAQGFVSNRLLSSSDAAVTAKNILENRSLIQIGYTVYLIEMAAQVATTALLYLLLRPVSRDIALVAAFIDMTASVIKTMARVFYVAPLFVLSGTSALSAFNTDQLRGLAILLLRIDARAASMATAFFAVSGLLNGYLIYRSTFLPRALGILAMAASVGWLRFAYPPLRFPSFTFIAVFALVAAAVKIFLLIRYGVDEKRWMERYRLSNQIPG